MAKLNINYIDKTIQQALISRSILLALLPVLALIVVLVSSEWSYKWWGLFLMLCVSLYIAIPSQMRTRAVFGKLIYFPRLALQMMKNILHLDSRNKDFLHTTHGH